MSLTAGTVLQGTRVPLRKWFLAIFFVARHKQGISALQLQRDLGLGSDQTVSHRHLPRYLLEFTYRLNRRGIADRLFFYLARRAMQTQPLTYQRLTAEGIG